MGGAIGQLQSSPGRLVQPVETASYDAWIKLYRPNENSGNTSISYYTKGMVIGFLLDARIRKLTENAKSLDDAMVLAYKRHGWDKGFTPEEFRNVASEVAGSDLSAWFRNVLETTNELDYSEALDFYGLRFRPASTAKSIVTGATVSPASGRLIVTRVQRNTAAWNAGLNVDDELIAVEDNRLRNDQWPSLLDYYKGKAKIKLLINRRDKLVTLELPIVQEPPASWTLEVKSDATAEQKANLNIWLRQ
jgi:predicted metalloprotease with PDZ domain